MKEENDRLVYMYVFGNGNMYVGQTNDIERRMNEGFNGRYNDYVINTMNKYGIVRVEILGRGLNQEEADEYEIKAIEDFNTLNVKYGGNNSKGLNLSPGGNVVAILTGEKHPNSKLTNNQVYVVKMRLMMGDRQSEIAADFDVKRSTISDINNRRSHDNTGLKTPINSNYNSTVKLTHNQVYVVKMRLMMGDSQSEIAADFDVKPNTISNINNRKRHDNTGLKTPINSNYNSTVKLTQNQVYVIKMRLMMGDRQSEIAADFGVGQSTISMINVKKAHL